MRLEEAKQHISTATRSYFGAVSKFALAAAFTGFGEFFSPLFSNLLVYGGAGVAFLSDVIPTILDDLPEEYETNQLLIAIHLLKKIVAAGEGLALIGVWGDKTIAIGGGADTAAKMTDVLVPSFATILLLKGALGLLTDIEKMAHKGLDLESVAMMIPTSIGTAASGGVLIASLKKLLAFTPACGINAIISAAGGVALLIRGIKHSCQVAPSDQEAEALINNLG